MKIERINENQIKIILSRADLAARNLNINELAYSNEKMQSLFREMMEQAFIEHSFKPENNTSLMIEAAMLSPDSIMIIVTKVSSSEEHPEFLNLIPKTKEDRMFRKKPIVDISTPAPMKNEGIQMYAFMGIDDIASASVRLIGRMTGDNRLYKLTDKYFLVLDIENDDSHISAEGIDNILGEYGARQYSSMISESYLKEHGEIIIGEAAIAKLARI